jgi:hypothetical protein
MNKTVAIAITIVEAISGSIRKLSTQRQGQIHTLAFQRIAVGESSDWTSPPSFRIGEGGYADAITPKKARRATGAPARCSPGEANRGI